MKLVAYSSKSGLEETDFGSNHLPKSLVATEYHVLLLFKDQVKALCVLNGEVIFEDVYDEVNGILFANLGMKLTEVDF